MPPVVYAGALAPKKKSELQEIASALRISDQGTKDELAGRIKAHLDSNQDTLEDNPTFSGLFGRRKRSVQPQPAPPSTRFAPPEEKPKSSRRVAPLDPIKESTPVKDLRDVSTFLKHPISPFDSTPSQSPRQVADPVTPSSLPPLPPSPVKSIIERLPNTTEVKAAVQQFKQQEILQHSNELLIAFRAFLSNSRNIWSLTALFELLYVLYTIIPWQIVQVPISPRRDAGPSFPLHYPPLSVFQTSAFWLVLLHWALPTLIIPSFVGRMISFNPLNNAPAPSKADIKTSSPAAPIAPFDPLTASIIRLAAQVAYPYASIATSVDIVGLDVLGSHWRVLSASVGLAFAFAEAIAGAPQVLAKTLLREQRHTIAIRDTLDDDDDDDERQLTPRRLALMALGETVDAEVD
ncbi:unnamed protein product [Cyclocybe aegerita]|uniref:SAP domain-containing protein n=1 Tax=Cyclocybe aegerita TaxID=1973307 RepID=A0A8S0XPG7_CYCAE|nr:unnamed protein product [Cyclocybe aegerita]